MELTQEISVEREQFLSGGGEMGRLIRSIDWSLTPVGVVNRWPQSLRTAISIMLNARFPMYIAWGKEFTQFYNDGYRPILGSKKHPQAMGLSTKITFAEIWNIIGPMFEGVLQGEAVGFEDFMLPLDRNGYTEECYFIFSYSPIKQENGSTGGVLVTVTETTERVLSERRLNTLSELGERAAHAQNRREACSNTLLTLSQNKFDIPFSALYLYDRDKQEYEFVGSTGLHPDSTDWSPVPCFSQRTGLSYHNTLPVEEVFGQSLAIEESAWPETPEVCSFIRLERPDMDFPLGLLVLGISARLRYDGKYVKFFKLISEHTTTALSNATAFEEERKRAEALRELDKAKTTFFSNISHEFRTPLTLLLGPVEGLLNNSEDITTGHRETLQAVHRNGMRLLRLVNTLLDFSRIEAGRMTAKYFKVDLCVLTFDLASTFRSVIESAGLRFDVECHEAAIPAYVDKPMWEKIILNLLSNAFKYTLQGKIVIRVLRRQNTAVVEVEDTGVGIPEDELPRIFERFHRVKNVEARTFEGTGIGLSLVKELVQLHHGEIMVASQPGKGTMFTVTIPLGKEHLDPSEVVDVQQGKYESVLSDIYVKEAASLTGAIVNRHSSEYQMLVQDKEEPSNIPVVLVVDDNPDMREYIQKLLSPLYRVRLAENGRAALATLEEYPADVIISDIMMPVMDGYELLQHVKSTPATAKTPLILLSARAGEEARIEGYNTGADDYLIKPFSAKELIARVQAQIRIAATRKNAESQLANAFNLAPVATSILMGPEFLVVQANALMLEVWGKTAEQVMNKRLIDGFPEIANQGIIELLTHVLTTGERFVTSEHPTSLVRRGKLEETILNFVYEPLREIDGSISGVIAVANDVTELVHARTSAQRIAEELERKVGERTAELILMNDELRVKNNELEQFAYVASHDLQEPLRKIQTFSELVLRNLDYREVAERYLIKIDASAARMSNLIKDVLTFSSLSGSFQTEQTDLNVIIKNILDDYELAIVEKQAIVQCDALPVISGIPIQLTQLFSNLVSNSLKFSLGIPRIEITAWPVVAAGNSPGVEDEKKNYVNIQFRDHGIGFDPAYSEKVFVLFQRLNHPRDYEGTGIGLALCKKIVENHGGKISVHSEAGQGTTFDILFPAEKFS